jgi:hypothetical protein
MVAIESVTDRAIKIIHEFGLHRSDRNVRRCQEKVLDTYSPKGKHPGFGS